MQGPQTTILLDQDRDTPPDRWQTESGGIRSAYTRSADSRSASQPGQDYLLIWQAEGRLVFALCDGVSQSFFGELASSVLGLGLINWLWRHASEIVRSPAETNQAALARYLDKMIPGASQFVEEFQIPADVPELVRSVLEQKRSLGSESMFVCGVLDTDKNRAFFAWMGDSRLRMWGKNGEFFIQKDTAALNTGERWSTRKGSIGSLHCFGCELTQINHLLAYSDGMYLLDDFAGESFRHASLNDAGWSALMEWAHNQPSSDDQCFFEWWPGALEEMAPPDGWIAACQQAKTEGGVSPMEETALALAAVSPEVAAGAGGQEIPAAAAPARVDIWLSVKQAGLYKQFIYTLIILFLGLIGILAIALGGLRSAGNAGITLTPTTDAANLAEHSSAPYQVRFDHINLLTQTVLTGPVASGVQSVQVSQDGQIMLAQYQQESILFQRQTDQGWKQIAKSSSSVASLALDGSSVVWLNHPNAFIKTKENSKKEILNDEDLTQICAIALAVNRLYLLQKDGSIRAANGPDYAASAVLKLPEMALTPGDVSCDLSLSRSEDKILARLGKYSGIFSLKTDGPAALSYTQEAQPVYIRQPFLEALPLDFTLTGMSEFNISAATSAAGWIDGDVYITNQNSTILFCKISDDCQSIKKIQPTQEVIRGLYLTPDFQTLMVVTAGGSLIELSFPY